MERHVIEELEGAHRNPVEGVSSPPLEVRNLAFDRAGGYTPVGGRDQSWLGDRAVSGILLEDGDALLLQDSGKLKSEWQPAAFFDAAVQLAYDETSMSLISGPQVWHGNELQSLMGAVFQNENELALAPRGGILAPWRRSGDAFSGGSYYLTSSDILTAGLGAGTAAITENAGTGMTVTNYEIVWVIEAPTDAGLVVHAVGRREYDDQTVERESLTATLNQVYPVGTVVRFYMRPDTEDTFELLSVVVSDGTNAPAGTLKIEGTWAPTEDALVNFAGGRAEMHNRRAWGRAGEPAFTPIRPTSFLKRDEGSYMLADGGTFHTTYQYGTVANANMCLVGAGDYAELRLQRFHVQRPTTDQRVVVPLFANLDATDENVGLMVALDWLGTETQPRVRVLLGAGSGSHYLDASVTRVNLAAFTLGRSAGSSITVQDLVIKFTLDAVTAGSSILDVDWTLNVDLDSGASEEVSGGDALGTGGGDWTSYAGSLNSRLSVGRMCGETSIGTFFGSATLGNRALRVTHLEGGNGVTVRAFGGIEDYASGTTWTSSSPNTETWTTTAAENMVITYAEEDVDPDADPIVQTDLTLVYSVPGSVNRGRTTNFLPFTPLVSTKITALASTPAGLLVFMENETFLVRGDPSIQGSLSVQRLTATLGCDPGVIPARVGSVVMPIYKGEVYAINLGGGDVDFGGSVTNISRPVWLPEDPFVQAVYETKRKHLVAMTSSGRVYRLDVDHQKWLNCVFDEVTDLRYLIGANIDQQYGTRYNVGGYLEVVSDDIIDVPWVKWAAQDLGDKNVMKLWRRVELFTEGAVPGAPIMRYSVRGVQDEVNGIEKGDGRLVFTFKRGVVGPTADLEFKFLGATRDLVMEPPVVIEYVPRYRQR